MRRTLLILALLTGLSGFINAQSPKREFRAAWLTTVWRIDWPKTNGATAQKNEMTALLDQLQSNNINAVCFQVRGRCDAFYNSAYEPWSSDLGVARGTNPGYDPLQFVIDEAHKRGIEVHAWLNPYRYESTYNAWSNTTLKGNYRYSNPSWIIDYSSGLAILNPGIPEVRQRIVDVVADILGKYDVDGIIFDDYFYGSGTTDAMDQTQYITYNPTGMSRANWRRDNVNQMIKAVYDKIQTTKPYVTFGVSPAGVAKGGAFAVGLTQSIGSDWQYNDIFSDPCAWLSQGTLDYISPQIYWAIGHSTNDYDQLCNWWSYAAHKFGKHFYSSHSSSSMGASELNNQILRNRDYTKNNAPGSIFYNTTGLTPSLATIKSGRFTHKALRPAVDWKTHPAYSNVSGVSRSGASLTWNAVSLGSGNGTARYTVYAVPSSVSVPVSACNTSQYLLGVSYTNSYTLPSSYASTSYNFVVGLLDRFGNEFITGVDDNKPTIPVITAPADGATVASSVTVTWNAQTKATQGFTIERATSSNFSGATSTNVAAGAYQYAYSGLTAGATYYVRVRALYGTSDATEWSAPVNFTITIPAPVISAPSNGATGVSTSPTITWNSQPAASRGFTVDRATNSAFTADVVTNTISAGTYQCSYSGLANSTTYYVRVRANFGTSSTSDWSSTVSFTTAPGIPVISAPANGSTVASSVTVTWNTDAAASRGFSIDRATNSTFTAGLVTNTVASGTYQYVYSGLTAGTTYYVRVKANYGTTSETDWSSTVSFTIATVSDIPKTPVITSPVNGEAGIGSSVTVKWNPEPAATGFRAEISTTNGFTSGVTAGTSVAGVYQQTFNSLSIGTTYYVRVRATYEVSSNTDWSDVVSFVSGIPVITAPTDGASVSSPVTVTWNTDSRASRGYNIERCANSSFSSGVTTSTINAGTYQTTYSGLANGDYYVRVQAKFGTNSNTAYSPTVKFTVISPVPILRLVIGTRPNSPYTPLLASPPTVNAGETVYLGIDDKNNASSPNYISRLACALTSSNPAVAEISDVGEITTKAGGTTTIKAVRQTGGTGEGTITLTVNGTPPKPVTLTLSVREEADLQSPALTSIIVKESAYLFINEPGGANVNRQDCVLTSSNTNVATIAADGKIIANKIGQTTIAVVRSSDNSQGTFELSVVGAPVPPGITLNLSSISTPNNLISSEVNMNTKVYLWIEDNVSREPVLRQYCTLTSSDTNIASIDKYGAITTKNIGGVTTITAVRNLAGPDNNGPRDGVSGTLLLTVLSEVGMATPTADGINVIATATGVEVQFEGDAVIELYTVNGILIEKAQASQFYSRDLANGVYIIRVNGQAMKFVR